MEIITNLMVRTDTINIMPIGQGVLNEPCVIYTPDVVDPTIKLPLIIAAHGTGEAGTDPTKLYTQGLSKVLYTGFIPPFPCAVLCPQRSSWSVDPGWLQGILDHIVEKIPNVDNSIVVTTGLSAGGWFAWGSIFNTPIEIAKRVVGVAALSAVTNDLIAANYPRIKDLTLKIISISGDLDKTVTYQGQLDFANYINSIKPGSVNFYTRTGIAHSGWVDIYNGSYKFNNQDFWSWAQSCFKTTSTSTTTTSSTTTTTTTIPGPKLLKEAVVQFYDDGSVKLK